MSTSATDCTRLTPVLRVCSADIISPSAGEWSIVRGVYVCLSVRKHISGITRPNAIKSSAHVACGWGSVHLWWWHCNTFCTSGFDDDVMFSYYVPYSDVTQPQQLHYCVVHGYHPLARTPPRHPLDEGLVQSWRLPSSRTDLSNHAKWPPNRNIPNRSVVVSAADLLSVSTCVSRVSVTWKLLITLTTNYNTTSISRVFICKRHTMSCYVTILICLTTVQT